MAVLQGMVGSTCESFLGPFVRALSYSVSDPALPETGVL